MVGCFEVNKSIKNDRNRIRMRQRFCVVQCEDLKVLYYREHEMRGIKRPQLRVVPKETYGTYWRTHTPSCLMQGEIGCITSE